MKYTQPVYVADNFISLYTVFIFQNDMEKYSQSDTPDIEEQTLWTLRYNSKQLRTATHHEN